ncbi:hypothetical protein [Nostoc sp.]|uniref:hypothetical protein n=1 Tax=Nostoc sp. TaxID=1180 RepID=UPI002FF4CD48
MLKIRSINHRFNSATPIAVASLAYGTLRERASQPALLYETLRVACFQEVVRQSYFSARGCALSVAMPQTLRLRSIQVSDHRRHRSEIAVFIENLHKVSNSDSPLITDNFPAIAALY